MRIRGDEILMNKREVKRLISHIEKHGGEVVFTVEDEGGAHTTYCQISLYTPHDFVLFTAKTSTPPNTWRKKWFGRCLAFSRAWMQVLDVYRVMENWFVRYMRVAHNVKWARTTEVIKYDR
jgi:hypothetical protein